MRNAAKSFGMCLTRLKAQCRTHKIARWPNRQIEAILQPDDSLKAEHAAVRAVGGAVLSTFYNNLLDNSKELLKLAKAASRADKLAKKKTTTDAKSEGDSDGSSSSSSSLPPMPPAPEPAPAPDLLPPEVMAMVLDLLRPGLPILPILLPPVLPPSLPPSLRGSAKRELSCVSPNISPVETSKRMCMAPTSVDQAELAAMEVVQQVELVAVQSAPAFAEGTQLAGVLGSATAAAPVEEELEEEEEEYRTVLFLFCIFGAS